MSELHFNGCTLNFSEISCQTKIPAGVKWSEKMSSTILCVDDDKFDLVFYKAILDEAGYTVLLASCGEEALNILSNINCDLVLLDHTMPNMSGLEVCRAIRSKQDLSEIPVVYATSCYERSVKMAAFEAGVSDFISKPVDPIELAARIRNLLKAKEHKAAINEFNSHLEEEVRLKSSELRNSYIETIRRLTIASEYKDKDTANHITRISYYSLLLATTLGWSKSETEIIYYASPMHDVGKIGIPDSILNKPDKLNEAEFEIMKGHTVIGSNILANSTSPILKCAELIARDHHEYFDGSGYPDGKSGEEISKAGRLICLVDVYDALRMRRPYKTSLPHEQTIQIMTLGDGRTIPQNFDPQILEAFMDVHHKFDEIYTANKEFKINHQFLNTGLDDFARIEDNDLAGLFWR